MEAAMKETEVENAPASLLTSKTHPQRFQKERLFVRLHGQIFIVAPVRRGVIMRIADAAH